MSNPIKDFFAGGIAPVREINRKYAVPKIKMTKPVKFILLFLRFYLLFLVALLVYKFIITVTGH